MASDNQLNNPDMKTMDIDDLTAISKKTSMQSNGMARTTLGFNTSATNQSSMTPGGAPGLHHNAPTMNPMMAMQMQ